MPNFPPDLQNVKAAELKLVDTVAKPQSLLHPVVSSKVGACSGALVTVPFRASCYEPYSRLGNWKLEVMELNY
jgi:hypothetical protein